MLVKSRQEVTVVFRMSKKGLSFQIQKFHRKFTHAVQSIAQPWWGDTFSEVPSEIRTSHMHIHINEYMVIWTFTHPCTETPFRELRKRAHTLISRKTTPTFP